MVSKTSFLLGCMNIISFILRIFVFHKASSIFDGKWANIMDARIIFSKMKDKVAISRLYYSL